MLGKRDVKRKVSPNLGMPFRFVAAFADHFDRNRKDSSSEEGDHKVQGVVKHASSTWKRMIWRKVASLKLKEEGK